LVAAASPAAISIGKALSSAGWSVNGSQSALAASRLGAAHLEGRGLTTLTLVVHDDRYVAGDPEFGHRVDTVVAAAIADRRLEVSSAYGFTTLSGLQQRRFVGKDRRTALVSLGLALDEGAATQQAAAAERLLSARVAGTGLQVALVGSSSLWSTVDALSQEDLVRAELVTLPLIALILVLIYQSLVAVLLSIAVGVSSIVLTLAVLSPLAQPLGLSIFLENTASMLGLGIGVDYSLIVLSRYRDELRAGAEPAGAVTTALRTSGRTVLFSALTSALTMAALFVVRLGAIESIALGAVVVVAISLLVATCMLPVALHLLGRRIDAGRVQLRRRAGAERRAGDGEASSSRWHRMARAVMRRPAVF
jgi:RND superfamily putative drug exporter